MTYDGGIEEQPGDLIEAERPAALFHCPWPGYRSGNFGQLSREPQLEEASPARGRTVALWNWMTRARGLGSVNP